VEEGGRGSELLLRRPPWKASSATGCGGGGCEDGVRMPFCAEGLRILIEPLRSLCEFECDGLADGAGGCRCWAAGTGTGDIDLTIGLVTVVDRGPKCVTEVPCPGVVECVVVVVYGPWVVIVVVEVVDDPCGRSVLP